MSEEKKEEVGEGKLKVKKIIKNKLFWLLIFGFSISIINHLVLWLQIKPNQAVAILHYNSFLGIDVIEFDLASKYYELFLAPLGAGIILIINAILAFLIYPLKKPNEKKEEKKTVEKNEAIRLGALLLLLAGVAIQFCALVYVIAIVRVNS